MTEKSKINKFKSTYHINLKDAENALETVKCMRACTFLRDFRVNTRYFIIWLRFVLFAFSCRLILYHLQSSRVYFAHLKTTTKWSAIQYWWSTPVYRTSVFAASSKGPVLPCYRLIGPVLPCYRFKTPVLPCYRLFNKL